METVLPANIYFVHKLNWNWSTQLFAVCFPRREQKKNAQEFDVHMLWVWDIERGLNKN